MGAWGTGSFDNDTALDFIEDLISFDALKKMIRKNQLDYDKIRVAAEILIHLHKINSIWVNKEIISILVIGLEAAIQDTDWHDTWRDPADAKKLIKQLKSFVKTLKTLESF